MLKLFPYSPSPDISIAVVMLHPGCNMTCAFCVSDTSFSAMSWTQAVHLLHQLDRTRVNAIVLGGGEPLTWKPGVFELAKHAGRRGFHVQISTNGVSLPDGYERMPCVHRYVLPLDSANESLHDSFRTHRPGHHGIIMNRLDVLRRAKKPVTVSTVVTSKNKHSLPEMAAFLSDYSATGGCLHAWHLYKFVPQGRGGKTNAGELHISSREYLEACEAVRERELGFRVYLRKDMFNSRTVDFFWAEGDELRAASQASARRHMATEPLRSCEPHTLLPRPASPQRGLVTVSNRADGPKSAMVGLANPALRAQSRISPEV